MAISANPRFQAEALALPEPRHIGVIPEHAEMGRFRSDVDPRAEGRAKVPRDWRQAERVAKVCRVAAADSDFSPGQTRIA